MNFFMNPFNVEGLPEREAEMLDECLKIFDAHKGNNAEKNKYYEGKISLNEVNLGIALPEGMKKLEIGCAWGAKAVDVLASRSKFDGFVDIYGSQAKDMDQILTSNNLLFEYIKACRDELKFGCTFSTLSYNKEYGCKIRFHSPMTSAASWNGEKGRIKCGFAIIDTVEDESQKSTWVAKIVNFYTDLATWVIEREDGSDNWSAKAYPHKMKRPLMEPLIWNATSLKPFGRSRIKEPIRRLIQGYVRTMANASIALEFSTAPQKYLLGLTDEQADALVGSKFKQYVGSIIGATTNPETG